MAIDAGDTLPDATVLEGTDGYPEVRLHDLTSGKRVVLFGLPGAFTRTCSATHLPSFIRTADAFRQKGIDEIICLSVNDVFVMAHWGETSGASAAGIRMIADWNSDWTKAAGLAFSAPPVGFIDRCQRCALIATDNRIEILQMETERGVCSMTAGETLLDML